MPMKSIWLLCLLVALKQHTMNGNGVFKASIGRIYFKQLSTYIGEYCVYNDF